jgi:hypothetical protein
MLVVASPGRAPRDLPLDLLEVRPLRDVEVVLALQVDPELRSRAEVCASLSAVSAVMPRLPFTMAVARFTGTCRAFARAYAVRSSSARNSSPQDLGHAYRVEMVDYH